MTDWYYGSDTYNGSGAPCGLSYYIGRKGAGTDAPGSSDLEWALPSDSSVYATGYWNVLGPNPDYAGSQTPAEWGAAQANAYTDAWNYNSANDQYVPSGIPIFTLFGSIDNPGWDDYTGWNTTDNDSVINSFLNQLDTNFGPSGGYKTYGLYGNPGQFSDRLGSGWSSPVSLAPALHAAI